LLTLKATIFDIKAIGIKLYGTSDSSAPCDVYFSAAKRKATEKRLWSPSGQKWWKFRLEKVFFLRISSNCFVLQRLSA